MYCTHEWRVTNHSQAVIHASLTIVGPIVVCLGSRLKMPCHDLSVCTQCIVVVMNTLQ